MTHTLSIRTKIPDDRRVEITVPPEVPTGEADVTVIVSSRGARPPSTGKDILNSEIFGMWADRTDIADSAQFTRELRERLWKRA